MAQHGVIFDKYDGKEDIESYFERLELFFTVNETDNGKKVPILLSSLGSEAYGVLKDLLSPAAPSTKSLAQLKAALKAHYKPAPPLIALRFAFMNSRKATDESMNDYLLRVRKLCVWVAYEWFNSETVVGGDNPNLKG